MKYIIFLACAFAIAEAQSRQSNPLASLTAYASRGAGSSGPDAASGGSGLSMFSIGMPGSSMPGSLPGMPSFGETSSGPTSGLPALSMPGLSGMPGMPGGAGMMGRGMLGAMAASGGNFSNIMKMQTYMAILMGRCRSINQVQKLLMLNGQFGDDIVSMYQCRCGMQMPALACLQISRNM